MKKLEKRLSEQIDLLINRYSDLEPIKNQIIEAYFYMEETYMAKKKLLIAGNGGSAADAEHIVGELIKGFKLKRTLDDNFLKKLVQVDKEKGMDLFSKLQGGLPALALNSHPSFHSAFLNDVDGMMAYAQQLFVFGQQGDVFLGISTSGNSKNIIYACIAAKALGIKTIAFTGAEGGELSSIADITVKVPQLDTYMVQELQLPIYHCWCLMLEKKFWKE